MDNESASRRRLSSGSGCPLEQRLSRASIDPGLVVRHTFLHFVNEETEEAQAEAAPRHRSAPSIPSLEKHKFDIPADTAAGANLDEIRAREREREQALCADEATSQEDSDCSEEFNGGIDMAEIFQMRTLDEEAPSIAQPSYSEPERDWEPRKVVFRDRLVSEREPEAGFDEMEAMRNKLAQKDDEIQRLQQELARQRGYAAPAPVVAHTSVPKPPKRRGSGKRQSRLVVKGTFLEVVETKQGEFDRDRSASLPVSMQTTQDESEYPSLTDQLLERMWDIRPHDQRDPMSPSAVQQALHMYSPPVVGEEEVQRAKVKEAKHFLNFELEVPVLSSPPMAGRSGMDHSAGATCSADKLPTAAAAGSCGESLDVLHEGPRTTVMLRNLPGEISRPMLLELLDGEGFYCQYNFIYLPIDFGSKSGFGYAFINLVDESSAQKFWAHFQGFGRWPVTSEMVADVSWSSSHQGFEEHVNRYRNSPVMHETMPDECKPIVLQNGARADFPPPTKNIRAPRIRPSKNRPGRVCVKDGSESLGAQPPGSFFDGDAGC